jgi:DNA-binding transcriptional regulator YbjK
LTDAAIALLGAEGARGLSHPRVDKQAQMPAGTASYFFRTRKALLQATAERVSELDEADLSMMTELADADAAKYSGTKGLAQLVILSSTEPWLTRTRARYELMLAARREPELAVSMLEFGAKFYGLAREVITKWHEAPVDAAVIDEQAVTVLTYVNGVMMTFVHGFPVVSAADQLDRRIQAILRSVDGR